MGYAVELLFDEQNEMILYELALSIKEGGIKNKFIDIGNKPHITLSVHDSIEDEQKAIELLNNFSIEPLYIDLQGVGTFPGKENTIFLIPKVTKELLEIQESFFKYFSPISIFQPYYHPEKWVPHCTIGMEIENDKLNQAFWIVRDKFRPIRIKVERLVLIKFRPVEVLFEKVI